MASQDKSVKGVVDIVFLIDVTGSMQHCIEALKNNISIFIDSLSGKDPNNSNPVKHWRGKVVGYRDFKVDREPYVDNAFVENADGLKRQLAALVADGGGDEPESLLEGLYRVANMAQTAKAGTAEPDKWRYRSEAARVVVIFTDASYHETMAEPAGGKLDDVINVVHSNRVILSVFAPDMPCYDALSAIDRSEVEMYAYDKSDPHGAQRALIEFTADQKNFQKTMIQLAKSVSKSAEVPDLPD